ncbi:MAG: hypothetical protein UV70_C0003G0050 [Parcubacteria group bacterium GW2011_GWA2_43_13]|nr:MAG: hypothetical protein UV70_C0003G0050 [Parcubacteria group bacterium GW2011_GWA2_43_13]OGY69367.1 MAG: hypothetical protein A3B94_03580 [Candidatus Jacksonbacteria bacterium RIFCSPHIGHO2_02_FULL_43_10]OGY70576.1 MAG: hypothetical protein A2986_02610 [Candidatus Jacksonbacteria bacterium RIFCSPLOWO2_01_FULL_44_13]
MKQESDADANTRIEIILPSIERRGWIVGIIVFIIVCLIAAYLGWRGWPFGYDHAIERREQRRSMVGVLAQSTLFFYCKGFLREHCQKKLSTLMNFFYFSCILLIEKHTRALCRARVSNHSCVHY